MSGNQLACSLAKSSNHTSVFYRVGALTQLTSEELKESFRNPADADAISALGDAFVDAIRSNTFKQKGFSQSMYAMSKICEMSYTRWLVGQLKSKVRASHMPCLCVMLSIQF
jgi:hypothetical protein